MPFCDVSRNQNTEGRGDQIGIKIFYKTYGHGPVKVLLIIGLAGTHDSWGPQIKGLTGTEISNDVESTTIDHKINDPDDKDESSDNIGGIEVCSFDNRGMGRSSIPTKKSEYTTINMAKDALALMDHLGWRKAHVFGHSMGSMIACKLAAMVPDRISSLALINATGGGFECFPKIDRKMISIAIRFLKAKTPEQRAAVDLDTHYTKEYLDELVGLKTRRTVLYQEYVKGISSTGMQSNYGFEGQLNACWTHRLTSKDVEAIKSAGFLISVIHGRYDIIAQIYYGRKLAEKLQPYARMVDLHGGHLVSHERPQEVNKALIELIKASDMRLSPHDWTNLPKNDTGTQLMGIQTTLSRRRTECGNFLSFMFEMLAKLKFSFVYLIGLFVMVFEHGRRVFKNLRPARVGAITS